MNEELLLYLTSVLAVAVTAQWLAWRLRLPSILLLLAGGVALGQFWRGTLDLHHVIPDELLFPVVSLSVAVILFEGGLTLRIAELRESGRAVLRLVTIGALTSWAGAAWAAVVLLQLDIRLATLLGAILVVTGPTVVGPMLRQMRPSRRVASVVKWEGIVIDPIGAVLAVLVFEFVLSAGITEGVRGALWSMVKVAVWGTVIGTIAAFLLMRVVKHFLAPDFLHVPIFLATALVAFTLSNQLQHEAGLVTVTVMGVLLANQRSATVKHVVEFKENLQLLLIGCLFVVLGSRIDLEALQKIGWQTAAFVGVLILVVRPVSVLLATLGSKMDWGERTLLAFLAPRGIVAAAVASIFAIELAAREGLPAEFREQALQLAPITFGVIIGTVLVYGLLAAPLARGLGLSAAHANGILFAGAETWVQDLAEQLQQEDVQVLLIDTDYSLVAAARMRGLPAECANVLAEYVQEELNLAGLGALLAVTPNEEVNALAAKEFVHIFGRANVYQLTPPEAMMRRRMAVAPHLRARLLFDERITRDEILRLLVSGHEFKRTTISEEYTFEQFQEKYGPSAVVLFVIGEKGTLTINTVEKPVDPQPGDVVLALVLKSNNHRSNQA